MTNWTHDAPEAARDDGVEYTHQGPISSRDGGVYDPGVYDPGVYDETISWIYDEPESTRD